MYMYLLLISQTVSLCIYTYFIWYQLGLLVSHCATAIKAFPTSVVPPCDKPALPECTVTRRVATRYITLKVHFVDNGWFEACLQLEKNNPELRADAPQTKGGCTSVSFALSTGFYSD